MKLHNPPLLHLQPIAITSALILSLSFHAHTIASSTFHQTYNGGTLVEAKGHGGNHHAGLYVYGENNHPPLQVTKRGERCFFETPSVRTVHLNHGYTGDQVFSFPCHGGEYFNTEKEINGAYSPLNDAHYFANQSIEMYRQWFGANPFAEQITVKVHQGHGLENAQWNIKQNAVIFGDGGKTYYPLTDVNITAHEIAHALTEQSSNLAYCGVSGAINESFSDIAGEATEYFLNGKVDWLVGANLKKDGSALRDFTNPIKQYGKASQKGFPIRHIDHYDDQTNMHDATGIFNHAFYLLATKPGWTVKQAFSTFYFANLHHWQRKPNFSEAACGVLMAAHDLALPVEDVADAFAQVGIQACERFYQLNSSQNLLLTGKKNSTAVMTFELGALTSSATLRIENGDGKVHFIQNEALENVSEKEICSNQQTVTSQTQSLNFQGAGRHQVVLSSVADFENISVQLIVEENTLESIAVGDEIQISSTQEQQNFFRIETSEDTPLSIQISGYQGDADLYVASGYVPTPNDYLCRPFLEGTNEQCEISNTKHEDVYLMIDHKTVGHQLTLSVQKSAYPSSSPEEMLTAKPQATTSGSQGGGAIFGLLGLILLRCYRHKVSIFNA